MKQQRSERTRTFLKAIIDYNNKAVQIDCMVKNLSATGARIELSEIINLPNSFNLRVPHRGETYRCSLVWRDKDSIGVRFSEDRDEPEHRAGHDLAELARENQRLKNRIRDLTARLEALGQDALLEERA